MVDKKMCTGCTACKAVCKSDAITMRTDNQGFKYPVIDSEKCISCGLCDKVCPVAKAPTGNKEQSVYCGYSKDKDTVLTGSSGGLSYVFANHILSSGGVVCGCTMSDDCYKAKHIIVKSKNELYKLKGSKYIQSDLGDVFLCIKDYLNKGVKVLFFGTPCQVAGMREYLKLSRVSDENLFLIDFICHGVPSPLVWKSYLESVEAKYNSKAVKVQFRDKSIGWKRYSLAIEFADGKNFCSPVDENLYLKGFISDLYLRLSCYNCKFKDGNYYSDMTLGDFWGVEKFGLDIYNENGVSIGIIHTPKGKELFSLINQEIVCSQIDLSTATGSNPSYYSAVSYNQNRDKFFEQFGENPTAKTLNKFCKTKMKTKLKHKMKIILGGK